ncbi:MAG: 23S rRNA (pseudouridine(1915)-N(3))-methyltransferase RlmH [Bacillota bacterium]
MRFRIVAVGRAKEPFVQAGVAEYLKRLTPYGRFAVIEVADEPLPARLGPGEERKILAAEGARIREALRDGDFVICLDRQGKAMSSEEFAAYLDDLAGRGRSAVAFVIGGTVGIDPVLLKGAGLSLSLSKMTMPHQLARLVLLEQVYRAVKISRGEPYHH